MRQSFTAQRQLLVRFRGSAYRGIRTRATPVVARAAVAAGSMHQEASGGQSIAAWRQQAADVLERARLQDVNQAFAVAGRLTDLPFTAATSWRVEGLAGTPAIPLRKEEVEGLTALAQPAPFGLNADTVLDPAVRKALQIDAARVTNSEAWRRELKKLTEQVAAELGVDPQVTVEARPYKLLVYTEGGHFKAHKDTEKEAGMFGTLVVQLPVLGGHEGGKLVFKHHGKMFEWHTEADSDTTFQYAAFYADVEHELLPITSGTRAAMVYNLVRTGGGAVPQALDGSPLVQELRAAVACWEQELMNSMEATRPNLENTPPYVCVPLIYQYTQASLSFSALKGTDAWMVGCLNHPDSGLDVHLVMFTRTEKYRDSCASRGDSHLETEYIVLALNSEGNSPAEEVLQYLGLTYAAGSRMPKPQELTGGPVYTWCREFKYEYENYDRDDIEDQRQPDELLHNTYTGNEGAGVDRIYYDTVAMIWPKASAESVLTSKQFRLVSGTGYEEMASYLHELRQEKGKSSPASSAVESVTRQLEAPQPLTPS